MLGDIKPRTETTYISGDLEYRITKVLDKLSDEFLEEFFTFVFETRNEWWRAWYWGINEIDMEDENGINKETRNEQRGRY